MTGLRRPGHGIYAMERGSYGRKKYLKVVMPYMDVSGTYSIRPNSRAINVPEVPIFYTNHN